MWLMLNKGAKCTLCKNKFLHSRNAFLHLCFLLCFVFLLFAEHFSLQNMMLNIFLCKMWCWTFFFGKCSASNAFVTFCFAEHFPKENVQHQQNVRIKCIWCKNAFDAKMHFGCAKMHLMRTFCFALQKCIFASNAFDAKMHFCNAPTKCYKCIWCQNAFWRTFSKGKCSAYILRSKMFSITFSKGKCSATLCKNAFDAKMHLMRTFCWCVAKMHLMLPLHFVYKMLESGKMHLMQKCIWCKNAFDAKMHFCNATRTFSFGKCSAYIFQRKMFSCAKMHLMPKCIWCVAKMHFGIKCILATRTFYEVKCSASHFPLENVQLCKNAFDAKMLCFLLCKKQRCCPYILFTKC